MNFAIFVILGIIAVLLALVLRQLRRLQHPTFHVTAAQPDLTPLTLSQSLHFGELYEKVGEAWVFRGHMELDSKIWDRALLSSTSARRRPGEELEVGHDPEGRQ